MTNFLECNITIFFDFILAFFRKIHVIDEKINRYKFEINLAKRLSSMKHADRDYYENLVLKFEKIINFYEDLKIWRKFGESE